MGIISRLIDIGDAAFTAGAIGTHAYDLGKATNSIQNLCIDLAASQSPSDAQRSAIRSAFEEWAHALSVAGGDVGQGILGLSDPLAELIDDLRTRTSPPPNESLLNAYDSLDSITGGPAGRYETGLLDHSYHMCHQVPMKPSPPPPPSPLAATP
ncbi:MAG: hypothetical protein IPG34_17800 [Rhodocyclaceae bacterium]|nr:hypothetical protein [Rhodocyclaceae bacterium]